jgi:MFS family permease
MTLAMSTGGLLEMLVSQLVGRLCDQTGRRPWMLVNHMAMIVSSLLTFLNPSNLRVVLVNRMLVWSFGAIFGGIAHSSAALSDLLEGDALGAAFSRLFSHVGAGVLTGLTIGSGEWTRSVASVVGSRCSKCP